MRRILWFLSLGKEMLIIGRLYVLNVPEIVARNIIRYFNLINKVKRL